MVEKTVNGHFEPHFKFKTYVLEILMEGDFIGGDFLKIVKT